MVGLSGLIVLPMEKIKIYITILLTVTTTINCKKKVTENSIAESSKQEIIVTKSANDLKCSDFFGKWDFVNNNKVQDFHLEFSEDEMGIAGEHCFIKGAAGENIDCSTDQSIFLDCEGLVAKGTVESAYADDLIQIEFYLISKDTLKLKTLSDTGMSFFYSNMLFKKK